MMVDWWVMAVLPSRRFGSLYNQNHNYDDDYQKKEGGYDDSPPHGFQKSGCQKKKNKKKTNLLLHCYVILPYQIKK